jgi:hypothetical protein
MHEAGKLEVGFREEIERDEEGSLGPRMHCPFLLKGKERII